MKKKVKRASKSQDAASVTSHEASAIRTTRPAERVGSTRIADALIVPVIATCCYLYFWFGPTVSISDPWSEAWTALNTADKTDDPARKQQLFERSGSALKDVVAKYPYHARLHFVLGIYYVRTGQFDASITHAKEAIRLGSGAIVNQVDGVARDLVVEATLKKARPLVASHDYAAALAVLQDAYRLAPDDRALLLMLGNVCILQKNYDDAARYLEAALKTDPNNAEIYMVLGSVERSRGRRAQAIGYLEKAVALDPRLTTAQSLLTALKNSPPGN